MFCTTMPPLIHSLTPLLLAVQWKYPEIVRYLIHIGANIEARDKDGHTPLALAFYQRHYDIASILIDNGALMDSENNDGETILFTAVLRQKGDSLSITQTLLENGADIEKGARGVRPLTLAAILGKLSLVRLLLSYGADVNAADKVSHTALAYAAMRGDVEIARLIKMLNDQS